MKVFILAAALFVAASAPSFASSCDWKAVALATHPVCQDSAGCEA